MMHRRYRPSPDLGWSMEPLGQRPRPTDQPSADRGRPAAAPAPAFRLKGLTPSIKGQYSHRHNGGGWSRPWPQTAAVSWPAVSASSVCSENGGNPQRTARGGTERSDCCLLIERRLLFEETGGGDRCRSRSSDEPDIAAPNGKRGHFLTARDVNCPTAEPRPSRG